MPWLCPGMFQALATPLALDMYIVTGILYSSQDLEEGPRLFPKRPVFNLTITLVCFVGVV